MNEQQMDESCRKLKDRLLLAAGSGFDAFICLEAVSYALAR